MRAAKLDTMTADELLSALYDAADDRDVTVLDDLFNRAGLTWECFGDGDLSAHWTARVGEVCDACGRSQAVGSIPASERETEVSP